jgi:arylsulfatase
VSVSGPYDRWPTHSGFDKFYGFIGGETNQWAPAIYDGTVRVEAPVAPDYHFTVDMTNQCIQWMQAQHSLTPDKPFFVYFATGALHAPHHVPQEYIARYKGQFDMGWDKLREQVFARQKKMGIIPKSAELTKRPKEIPSWDSQTADQRKLEARQMETFAGFCEHTDEQVGRLVDALNDMGVMNNTLFIYIVGDNGASAEGGPEGAYNEMMALNGIINTAAINMPHIDEWGSPKTFPHYAIGWAWAGDTPFQWTKQIASHYGGTTNGVVIHWPSHIKSHGEVRSQFTHVTDIAPTVLEAAGLPFPKSVNGTEQHPFDGTSMVYSFDDGAAKETHTTQYFEMFGNRGIYHRGWSAVTKHRTPWVMVGDLPPFDDDVWELYDGGTDYSQARNLAADNREMLAKLQRLWLIEATKYNVLPMDDRGAERLEPALAGRPTLIQGTSQRFFPGMGRLSENSVVSIKNKSFSVTAEVVVPDSGAEGVIIAQGGRFGGWALYAKSGRAKFVYNVLGIHEFATQSDTPIPAGTHQVRVEFAYDGGGLAKGGDVTLYYDGTAAGTGRVGATQPMIFSADETTDIGHETGTTVTPDYTAQTSRFTGKINWVQIDLGTDDHDHFIDPDERLRVAMARQ